MWNSKIYEISVCRIREYARCGIRDISVCRPAIYLYVEFGLDQDGPAQIVGHISSDTAQEWLDWNLGELYMVGFLQYSVFEMELWLCTSALFAFGALCGTIAIVANRSYFFSFLHSDTTTNRGIYICQCFFSTYSIDFGL